MGKIKFVLFVCSSVLFWLWVSKTDNLKNLSKGQNLVKKKKKRKSPKDAIAESTGDGFRVWNDGSDVSMLHAQWGSAGHQPLTASHPRTTVVSPPFTSRTSEWNLHSRAQCVSICQVCMFTSAVEPGRSDDLKHGMAC